MILRTGGAQDLDALYPIEAQGGDTGWSRDALSAALSHHQVLLAQEQLDQQELAGPVLGYVVWSVAADEAEILNLVVHPDHRLRGVARALLRDARVSWLRGGVERAFLEVRESNLGALALYIATGWAAVGRREAYYTSGEDALVLRWSR